MLTCLCVCVWDDARLSTTAVRLWSGYTFKGYVGPDDHRSSVRPRAEDVLAHPDGESATTPTKAAGGGSAAAAVPNLD